MTVGNELLFGETVDTNAAWIGRELAGEGIEIERRYTVGDDEDAIRIDPFVLVGFFIGRPKNAFELINSHGGILPDPPGDSRLERDGENWKWES